MILQDKGGLNLIRKARNEIAGSLHVAVSFDEYVALWRHWLSLRVKKEFLL